MLACSSTEPPSVESVVISPSNQSVASGSTLQLTAKGLTESGKEVSGRAVTWSATGAATISPTGLVTASSVLGATVQSASVTASIDGKVGSTVISVQPVAVASISLTASSPRVAKGDTLRITASVKGAGNESLTDRVIQWSVDDTTLASVSGSGVVTAKKSFGTFAVRATSGSVVGTLTMNAVCFVQQVISSDITYLGRLDNTDCPSTTAGLFYDSYRVGLSSARFITYNISNLSGAARLLTSFRQDTTFADWFWDYSAGGSGQSWFLFGSGSWRTSLRTQVVGASLDYQLRVTASTSQSTGCSATGTAIGNGLTVSRSLNECYGSSFYKHYYTTLLEAGQTITISLSSASIDTYLCIGRSDASTYSDCNDDISSTDSNSRITFTAPERNYYEIYTSSYNINATGPYTFSITSNPVYLTADVLLPTSALKLPSARKAPPVRMPK